MEFEERVLKNILLEDRLERFHFFVHENLGGGQLSASNKNIDETVLIQPQRVA